MSNQLFIFYSKCTRSTVCFTSRDIIANYVYKSLSNKRVLIFVVTSRRGDLEILGYVMLQWLCDRLPWEKNLNDKEYVRNEKTR